MDLENKDELLDEEGEELSSVITLTDEDGNDVEFEFADLIEYEGKEYVVLLPLEEDDNEVVILEVEPDADDPEMENYLGIEDEALLEAIFALFKERNQDEFNFV